jgi:hypothetical protein
MQNLCKRNIRDQKYNNDKITDSYRYYFRKPYGILWKNFTNLLEFTSQFRVYLIYLDKIQ